MTILRTLGFTALALSAVSVWADDTNSWGFVSSNYNVSASKLVAKDLATLDMSIHVKCAEQTSVAQEKLETAIAAVKAEMEAGSDYTLTTEKPEVVISSQSQYEVIYGREGRLNPHYVDTCNNNAEVTLGAADLDLSKKLFIADANLKVETRENLAGLSVLRQKLQIYAERKNKEDASVSLQVGTEDISVSESTRNSELQNLRNEKKRTRYDVDSDVAGGLHPESYSMSVQEGSAQYKRYRPTLTAEGKSKVEVPYTFNISYIPANLGTDTAAKFQGSQKGQISQTFQGVAVVDTDFYVGKIKFSSSCQATKEDALGSVKAAYETFNQLAKGVVAENGGDFERIESTLGQPADDGNWRALVQERNPQTEEVVVKSYVSLCNSSVVEDVKPEQRTYTITHDLTVITRNLAGLKDLQTQANAYTEEQRASRGAQRVEVVLQNIQPNLQDQNHFNAVEVLAYENAIQQLVSPHGEVANKLLDQIKASEAYYSATQGYQTRTRAMASAALDLGGGARAEAMVKDDSVTVIADENLPLEELRVDTVYSITYRPKKDLIQILKDGRASLKEDPEMAILK